MPTTIINVVTGKSEKPSKEGDIMGFPSISEKTKHVPRPMDDRQISFSRDNGVDFCSLAGYTQDLLSNGTQRQISTCSTTTMGALPSFENMVSTIILQPQNSDIVPLNTNVTVIIKSFGIDYGFFDDPTVSYYISPQTLNQNGQIQGHNHITVQKIEDQINPPDPKTPVFFKGLNEDDNNTGILSVEIDGQVFNTTGVYRICTMTASRSHAPVLMPVARRGAQDDCIRVLVVN
jgi:hypothetical protein